MKTILEKPYRIIWSEWDDRRRSEVHFIYYKKFATAKEAEAQMLALSESSTYAACSLAVIKEMGVTAAGKAVRV